MKTLILSALMITALSLQGQEGTDRSLARAYTYGAQIPIFFWSKPVAKYEVAFTFENRYEFTDGFSTILDKTLEHAQKEGMQQFRQFDAIILTHNNRDLAIKWKEEPDDPTLCRVESDRGILLFIKCEPVDQYDITVSKAIKMVWKNIVEESKNRLVKMAIKEKADAIIITNQTNDLVIMFK